MVPRDHQSQAGLSFARAPSPRLLSCAELHGLGLGPRLRACGIPATILVHSPWPRRQHPKLKLALEPHASHGAPRQASSRSLLGLQALRYGETLGLEGSEALAREIAGSQLGRRIEHPEFWRDVLRFFAAQDDLPMEHVGPIEDFIRANKFPTEVVLIGDRVEWCLNKESQLQPA